MQLQSFEQIRAAASASGRRRTMAVVHAHDEQVLRAVADAQNAHMARPILIGDTVQCREILEQYQPDWSEYEMIQQTDDRQAARLAVQLVRQGEADLLVKGLIRTSVLMQAVLDRDTGIRTGELVTHLMFYEPAGYKLLCLTDGGINPFPDLEKKKVILEHAAQAFQKFHYPSVTAACICGEETVHPELPSNTDAQALAAMNDYWRSRYNMTVYGPVGLDLAVSKQAVAHKGYPISCAGEADILLVPNYEVGNAMGKAMSVFAHAPNAGIVLGAQAPIALVSRADSARSKLTSMALGCILAD